MSIDKNTPNPSKASFYQKDSNGELTSIIAEQEAFTSFLNLIKEDILTSDFLINSNLKTLKNYAKTEIQRWFRQELILMMTNF